MSSKNEGKWPRKILVSDGWGAGWSSWANGNIAQRVAEYQPIIDFIEAGGDPTSEAMDPLIEQMIKELGNPYFYDGGRLGLKVETVNGPYQISEYDGNESVITMADDDGWFL